jgi:hypothetical protein
MRSRHLSLRMEDEAFQRLEAESRRSGRSRSELAKTLLDEGLRMEAHPGIVFRNGPGGRRAALAGGPDVWEVARVVRDIKEPGGALIEKAAELTSLPVALVQVVVSYYAAYQREIESWIASLDEEAAQAEAAWRREQQLLQR